MVNRGLEPTGFEPLDRLLDLLDDVHAANGHFEGMCPGHVGQRRALKITLGEKDGKPFPLLHCHAGCETKDILEELGLGWSDLHEDGRPGPRAGKQTTARGLQGTIEAIYDYVNLAGELVFQVVRYKDPKDFRQRTPNGSGGWIWSVKDIKPLPLYHLPEVVKAVSAKVPVTVLEGEKDVDRARDELGITATTCPEGADKWDPTHSQYLRGADVVLVPDNDGPGCKHMESVGRELLKVARSVKLLELPGLGDGGDLSDWIDAGGTAKEYRALVKEAPLFLHHQGMESDEERKPLSMSVAEFIAEAG